MARTMYVYVASWADRVESTAPLGVGTVKYEFVDWLARMRGASPRALDDVEVWRFVDVVYRGTEPNRTHLGTAAEFLAKERPGEASGA